jgi:leader peptidase (prepilin peptidase)/N-methyltransferase
MTEVLRMFFSSWYIYPVFGLIFGSFLNVVIFRVPNGLSILSPPSSCPKCGHRIRWFENIPVLSWLYLRAKCSSCGLPISVEYPLVELAAGLISTLLFFYTGPVPELLIYIALSYTLLCIMIVDYKTFSIPHGLNITLLAVSVSAVLMHHFVREFLPVSLTGSLLGGITGFGILFVIQKVGKIVYKQEAMGMGDLFLLGSAGLMLGPKLTLTAFILGSAFAVISYTVPSIINLLNRKKESLQFIRTAEEGFDTGLLTPDSRADLLGLQLQLFLSVKDARHEKIRQELSVLLDNSVLDGLTYLRLFFRFVASDDRENAGSVLKKINSDVRLSKENIRKVISEDMIGYDSYPDNLKLLRQYSEENSLNRLSEMLTDSDFFDPEEKYSDDIGEIESQLKEMTSDDEKLSLLLKHNRYFQFNGYTAEQKRVIGLIESSVDLKNDRILQKFLSETALVYFKDFYFKESSECLKKLSGSINTGKLTEEAAKNIYNLALFRYVFFR